MYCQTYHKEIWNSSPAKKLRRYGNRTPQTAFLTAETLKCYFHLVKRCVSLEGLKLALPNLLSFFFFQLKLEVLEFFIYYWEKYSCNPLECQQVKLFRLHFFFCFHFYFERWKEIEKVTCCVPCLFHSVSGAGGRGAGKIETGVVLN